MRTCQIFTRSIEWSLILETFDISAGLLGIPGKQGFINAIATDIYQLTDDTKGVEWNEKDSVEKKEETERPWCLVNIGVC